MQSHLKDLLKAINTTDGKINEVLKICNRVEQLGQTDSYILKECKKFQVSIEKRKDGYLWLKAREGHYNSFPNTFLCGQVPKEWKELRYNYYTLLCNDILEEIKRVKATEEEFWRCFKTIGEFEIECETDLLTVVMWLDLLSSLA